MIIGFQAYAPASRFMLKCSGNASKSNDRYTKRDQFGNELTCFDVKPGTSIANPSLTLSARTKIVKYDARVDGFE